MKKDTSKMLNVTLGSIEVGKNFIFGGVEFVKNKTTFDLPSGETLVSCDIKGEKATLTITDCTLVYVEK